MKKLIKYIKEVDNDNEKLLLDFFKEIDETDNDKIEFLSNLIIDKKLYKKFIKEITNSDRRALIYDEYSINMLTKSIESNLNDAPKIDLDKELEIIREHAKDLYIPILEGLNEDIKDKNNSYVIFSYSNGKGVIESLNTTGTLSYMETFDSRLKLILDSMKDLKYVKDYKRNFMFKVYFQNVVIKTQNRYIKTINAFFVDPKYDDFYELSISAGSFPCNDKKNDEDVTELLLNKMDYLMDSIRYK